MVSAAACLQRAIACVNGPTHVLAASAVKAPSTAARRRSAVAGCIAATQSWAEERVTRGGRLRNDAMRLRDAQHRFPERAYIGLMQFWAQVPFPELGQSCALADVIIRSVLGQSSALLPTACSHAESPH